MTRMWRELGRTVRAAITGWPATLRLMSLMAAATVIWLIAVSYTHLDVYKRQSRRCAAEGRGRLTGTETSDQALSPTSSTAGRITRAPRPRARAVDPVGHVDHGRNLPPDKSRG